MKHVFSCMMMLTLGGCIAAPKNAEEFGRLADKYGEMRVVPIKRPIDLVLADIKKHGQCGEGEPGRKTKTPLRTTEPWYTKWDDSRKGWRTITVRGRGDSAVARQPDRDPIYFAASFKKKSDGETVMETMKGVVNFTNYEDGFVAAAKGEQTSCRR